MLAKLLQGIETSTIVRWEGLRKYKTPDGAEGFIPLPNDGTLSAQLKGLKDICVYLSPVFSAMANPSGVALAYVARQVGRHNLLLNNQDEETRLSDSEFIDALAGRLESEDREIRLASTFRAVAGALRDKNDPLRIALDTANAIFYLETAMKAAYFAARREDGSPERAAALLLAANAWHNNIRIARERAPEWLVENVHRSFNALPEDVKAFILNPENYRRSLAVAAASKPSFDKA